MIDHNLKQLPTVKPNASRIIVSWSKHQDQIPPVTLIGQQVELNNSIQVKLEAAELDQTSVDSIQNVSLSPSTSTVQPASVTSPMMLASSNTTTSSPSQTETNPQTSSSPTTSWPRVTSTTTRKPTTPKRTTKATTASPASEPTDADQNSWLYSLHTTPRPYDPERDCGIRPITDSAVGAARNLNLNHFFRSRAGRVVGGRDSYVGEFPWSVLIRETTLMGFFIKTKCGGVLIDLKWVLTAAHCQPGIFGSLIVFVGGNDATGKPTPGSIQFNGANLLTGDSQHQHQKQQQQQQQRQLKPLMRKVKRMIIHRDYNPSNFDNDIALLELESPFELAPHVVPICLPDKDEQFFGQLASVAGWGKLSFGGPIPSVLQVARLPVIDNKHCQEMYHNSGHIKLISDSFLCAGYANGGQDSCEGDSGGPLQVQRRNDSRWVLVGTVSHGIKCAEPNLPGIYIRTTAYLPWIRAVTFHQDKNRRYGYL